MHKRLYIYRVGGTDRCALTAVKNEPRLPPVAPDRWLLWMQISPPHEDHRRYGFDGPAALQGIAADGYHVFTGSSALLSRRPLAAAPPAASPEHEDDG